EPVAARGGGRITIFRGATSHPRRPPVSHVANRMSLRTRGKAMTANSLKWSLAILAALAWLPLVLHAGAEPAAEGPQAGKPALTLKAEGMVWSVAFSPDGKRLACGTAASTVIVWDLKTGKQVQKLDDFKSKSIGGVAFSPDGKHLAVVGSFPSSPWIRDAVT